MADVPDAPDDLVKRLRSSGSGGTVLLSHYPHLRDMLTGAADRIEADAVLLDALRILIDALRADRDHFRARLAEADRLLREVAEWRESGRFHPLKVAAAIDAFLAGSATPPEAPQQTAQCGAFMHLPVSDRDVRCHLAQGHQGNPHPEGGEGWDDQFTDYRIVEIAGAVAPTEADRR